MRRTLKIDHNLVEYNEKSIRWQDYAINQLGFTNNIGLTLTIGFLAFAFDKNFLSTMTFSSDSTFNPKMLINLITVIFLLLSIISAVITSMSRLYDFRITRNITNIRKWYYNYCKNIPPLPEYHFTKAKSRFTFINIIFLLFFGKIKMFNKKEIPDIVKDYNTLGKYLKLKELTNKLGKLTWNCLRIQFLFLIIAIILYSVNLFV